MRKKGLMGLVGAALGMAAYNRRVSLPGGALERQLPVEPEMWRWRYGNVAIYLAGDTQAPPLLLLHGHNAAASAAEMEEPFKRLSERFHVYAPDLLGYGLSDRPPLAYTPWVYIELIEGLLREVVQSPAAVIASSLTAAHVIEAAAANPEWFTSLVLVCPTGVRTLQKQPAAGRGIEALLKLPVAGSALFNAIASRRSIRYFLEAQTFFDKSRVTTDLVEKYYRTAHVPGAQYAPAAFVSGRLYWDASEAWGRLQVPVLMVWGREGKITPATDAAAFLATNPAARSEEIARSGILPHDEQPEQFAQIVGDWLALDHSSGREEEEAAEA